MRPRDVPHHFEQAPDAAAGLPYVDELALTIDAPRALVWDALLRHIDQLLQATSERRLARVLGTEPTAGFRQSERIVQRRLALTGRHRFARYELMFELADAAKGTVLRAITYAAFPGLGGRIFRALVIGTRLHVLATRGMLTAVQRRALAA
jgi:hypothetical protein